MNPHPEIFVFGSNLAGRHGKVLHLAAFPDEKGGGGTGQGIRIAKDLGKPIFQYNRGSIRVSPQDIVKDILQGLQRFISETHHSSVLSRCKCLHTSSKYIE